MPNPNTIEWIHYQDIQVPDSTLRQQYEQYFSTGQYSAALMLLTNNATQLHGKAFIAELINTIATGIGILEDKFFDNVPIFLSNSLSQYNTLINNFIKMGEWSATAQYIPYNFVSSDGEIYMCIADPPVGTEVTNTTYWLYVGLRGNQGTYGVDLNMRFEWNNTDTYQPNDLVVYDGSIYVALQQNTNINPTSDPSIWMLFLITMPGGIFVGPTEPDYPIQNTVWFQTTVDPLTQTTADGLTGQFRRYNASLLMWEDMYPNTIFTWVNGASEYAPYSTVINVTIQVSDWQNRNYVYESDLITDDSFVCVFPGTNITDDQYLLYNSLTLDLSNNTVDLTAGRTPEVSLPIIIQIQ